MQDRSFASSLAGHDAVGDRARARRGITPLPRHPGPERLEISAETFSEVGTDLTSLNASGGTGDIRPNLKYHSQGPARRAILRPSSALDPSQALARAAPLLSRAARRVVGTSPKAGTRQWARRALQTCFWRHRNRPRRQPAQPPPSELDLTPPDALLELVAGAATAGIGRGTPEIGSPMGCSAVTALFPRARSGRPISQLKAICHVWRLAYTATSAATSVPSNWRSRVNSIEDEGRADLRALRHWPGASRALAGQHLLERPDASETTFGTGWSAGGDINAPNGFRPPWSHPRLAAHHDAWRNQPAAAGAPATGADHLCNRPGQKWRRRRPDLPSHHHSGGRHQVSSNVATWRYVE